MDSVLSELSAVPGVVGSLVCDNDGVLLGHSFPKLYDLSMLQEAAKIVSDGSAGMESVTGSLAAADFRYGESRLFVKKFTEGGLFILCNGDRTRFSHCQQSFCPIGSHITSIRGLAINQTQKRNKTQS